MTLTRRIATAALLAAASLSIGQGAGHSLGHTGHHPTASAAAKPMDMMKCMQDMRATQARLDALVAKMNAAQGADRIDATTAVVNELVRSHRAMTEMCHSMMMMSGHPMGQGSMHGQPMHGQPMHGQPMHGRPMKGHGMERPPTTKSPKPPMRTKS